MWIVDNTPFFRDDGPILRERMFDSGHQDVPCHRWRFVDQGQTVDMGTIRPKLMRPPFRRSIGLYRPYPHYPQPL